MEVVCNLEDGKMIGKLSIDTTPCLDLSFENNNKFYKIIKVETKIPKNKDDEKSFECIVVPMTEEQHRG